jgi:transposase
LPVVDQNGYIIATTGIMAGHHNDAYDLKGTITKVFHDLQRCGIRYAGALFNADSSFDTREARKMLWNRGVIPNIDENKRNRKSVKRGRKRHFNRDAYKQRFVVERTFAWIDKFRSLLIRFERKDAYWLGFHHLAFTLINLRNIIAKV